MKPNYVIARLGVAFASLVVIVISVGWLGINRLAELNREMKRITHDRWSRVELSAEALRYSSSNNRITMSVLLIGDSNQVKELLSQRVHNSARISDLLIQINAAVDSPEERSLLTSVEQKRKRYVETYSRALRVLLDERNSEKARKIMVEEALPQLSQYHGAWEEFVRFQGIQNSNACRLAEERFVSARLQMICLLIPGVLLSIAIAILTTRSLTREVESRQRARLLQQSRDDLELLVAQRTSELTKSNAELSSLATKLSVAHKELQSSEQKFRTLTDVAPIGVFLLDTNGHPIYRNPYCRQLCGDIVAGEQTDWWHTIYAGDLPGVVAAWKQAEASGRDFRDDFRVVAPDKAIRWVHCHTTRLQNDSGLSAGCVGIIVDITERKESEAELERVHGELVRASRESGMAEIATGVLHNVKNVINSINVSADIIADQVRNSKSPILTRAVDLLQQHSDDLGSFITSDEKGKKVPKFLEQLATQLSNERSRILEELDQFRKNVQHVKEIVVTQQTYAAVGGTRELAKPIELMEDALRINSAALARHGVQVVRDYDSNVPEINVEKHKVLQVLVNFMRNAKEACKESNTGNAKVFLRVTCDSPFVCLGVTDNGVGISPENLQHIFERGFTTKKGGHGFGLHSGILAARELGGTIEVASSGLGTGATFTLKLPTA